MTSEITNTVLSDTSPMMTSINNKNANCKVDADGNTILHLLAMGKIQYTDSQLRACQNNGIKRCVDKLNNAGYTALYLAVQRGDMRMATFLGQMLGADPNIPNGPEGETLDLYPLDKTSNPGNTANPSESMPVRSISLFADQPKYLNTESTINFERTISAPNVLPNPLQNASQAASQVSQTITDQAKLLDQIANKAGVYLPQAGGAKKSIVNILNTEDDDSEDINYGITSDDDEDNDDDSDQGETRLSRAVNQQADAINVQILEKIRKALGDNATDEQVSAIRSVLNEKVRTDSPEKSYLDKQSEILRLADSGEIDSINLDDAVDKYREKKSRPKPEKPSRNNSNNSKKDSSPKESKEEAKKPAKKAPKKKAAAKKKKNDDDSD